MTIWKFVLEAASTDLEMPADARVIHAHEQGGQICIWARVDPGARRVTRRLLVVGTGHEMPAECASSAYVGSVHLQGGAFVFHVYDRGEIASLSSPSSGAPRSTEPNTEET